MNRDLGKTQITPKIRVSSAAIFREEDFGKYYLVETWIFSDDPRQKSGQIIHGTVSEWDVKQLDGTGAEPSLFQIARKIHEQISNNLKSIFRTP